jgi:hypothetical protein
MMMKDICLIVGSCLWGLVVSAECCMGYEVVDGQLEGPCIAMKKRTGLNLVCVGFPLALILIAEVQIMNAVGAIGLTPMLETACLLGIAGFEQIRQMHKPLCLGAGLAFGCMCFIAIKEVACSLAACMPLAAITCVCLVWRIFFRDGEKADNVFSVIFMLMYLCSAFGRLFLLCELAAPSDLHFLIDLVAFVLILALLLIIWAVMSLLGIEG